MQTNENIGGYAQGDILLNIENIYGTQYDDIIMADNRKNVLYGGAGSDILYGYGGADIFYSGLGSDVLYGGSGSDTIRYDFSDTGVSINLRTE